MTCQDHLELKEANERLLLQEIRCKAEALARCPEMHVRAFLALQLHLQEMLYASLSARSRSSPRPDFRVGVGRHRAFV